MHAGATTGEAEKGGESKENTARPYRTRRTQPKSYVNLSKYSTAAPFKQRLASFGENQPGTPTHSPFSTKLDSAPENALDRENRARTLRVQKIPKPVPGEFLSALIKAAARNSEQTR